MAGEGAGEAGLAESVCVVAVLEGDVGVIKGAEPEVAGDANAVLAAPRGGLIDRFAGALDVVKSFLGLFQFFAQDGGGLAELVVGLAELLMNV